MPGTAKSSTLEVVNDATAYGVSIVPAQVVQGELYWKAIRVHHLTPQENNGNHHVFVDAVDQNDRRVYGTRISIKWPSGSGIGTIDKPLNEPGTNFPLWKGQVVEVEVVGRPSDRVVGLHTNHPDEGSGNTVFHHSFYIVFKLTTFDGSSQVGRSIIQGRVKGGAGMTVVLERDGQQVATTEVGTDEHYQFSQLLAGIYRVYVSGTHAAASNIAVDGQNTVTIDLEISPAGGETGPVIAHYVLFGSPDAPGTQVNLVLAQDFILRSRATCGFSVEEALHAAKVTIIGDVRGVSAADEERLTKAGIPVTRVSGDSYAVEEALSKM